jgi:hypothetical protein
MKKTMGLSVVTGIFISLIIIGASAQRRGSRDLNRSNTVTPGRTIFCSRNISSTKAFSSCRRAPRDVPGL